MFYRTAGAACPQELAGAHGLPSTLSQCLCVPAGISRKSGARRSLRPPPARPVLVSPPAPSQRPVLIAARLRQCPPRPTDPQAPLALAVGVHSLGICPPCAAGSLPDKAAVMTTCARIHKHEQAPSRDSTVYRGSLTPPSLASSAPGF